MSLEELMKEDPQHWADSIAIKLISQSPKKEKFICAAGISPSGIVHIGNFRDVITSDLVVRALKDRGYDAELIFSWDDYDRLRKIPKNVPESFDKYLWSPLAEIPDPYNCHHKSYAEHFESSFEESTPSLGINPRFIYQSKEYEKNRYYEGIKTALQKRRKIAEILASFKTQNMTDEEKENYYPLQVYCRGCNKSNATKIINYDGEDKISYRCECGNVESVDISKENVGKLDWKVDWPMRWKYEDVSFEPGGEDHATIGGSYDVSKEIAKKIYGTQPPFFQGYGFIGIEGASKMSSSKGMGISPQDLLEIYEPELLRWLFTKVDPKKAITLFFDSQIIRQYDEFDNTVEKYQEGSLGKKEARSLQLAKVNPVDKLPTREVSFRQVASFGQIAQGNLNKLRKMFDRIGQKYNPPLLKQRLEKSQTWIEKFTPELKINVRENPNKVYYTKMTDKERKQINSLAKDMGKTWDLEGLTTLVYSIPKKPGMSDTDKKIAQRNFFRNVYQMLIDNDTGPRLPTFLLALDEKRVRKLLEIKK